MAQLPLTVSEHNCPPSPLPCCTHSHCSSLTAPESACIFPELSCLISRVRPVGIILNLDVFSSCPDIALCLPVSAINKTVAGFSKYLYPVDYIRCHLHTSSKPSRQRYMYMLGHVQLWQSPPQSTVPGLRKRTMRGHGTDRSL